MNRAAACVFEELRICAHVSDLHFFLPTWHVTRRRCPQKCGNDTLMQVVVIAILSGTKDLGCAKTHLQM